MIQSSSKLVTSYTGSPQRMTNYEYMNNRNISMKQQVANITNTLASYFLHNNLVRQVRLRGRETFAWSLQNSAESIYMKPENVPYKQCPLKCTILPCIPFLCVLVRECYFTLLQFVLCSCTLQMHSAVWKCEHFSLPGLDKICNTFI